MKTNKEFAMKSDDRNKNDSLTFLFAGLAGAIALFGAGYATHHLEDDGLKEISPRMYVKDTTQKPTIFSYVTVRDFDSACMRERRVFGIRPQPQSACEILPAAAPIWTAR